ncbi:hypothetical protein H7849_22225 [Alloacidobacterium dinghuense]|uniref:Uncharacterized protein n=1 Tax=Alloacidobacterium dinghuense TaxID=2763107 RepID=A0A7G8BGR4_9BACT|nr:hypothetical protein [Alloacidobacterium dinghuense]QNI31734.1 hypothetical protein H7849_22225 [Alloacidobacterium dinghuense]
MPRFTTKKVFLIASLLPLIASVSFAVSTDRKLLSMIPPGAQSVAGITAPSSPGGHGNFVVLTHNSATDFNDFLALTGADSTRDIHQVVFVAIADKKGELSEHSLLANGHFDQQGIYKSAAAGGATVGRYRSISILAVPPFARERRDFDEVRSLAILDSKILLFGSIDSVRQEIDRNLDGSEEDPSIVERLNHLRRDDETWCLIDAPVNNKEIQDVLIRLDPALGRLVENGGTFQFGIHYSGHVEFEYEVTASSNLDSEAISDSLTTSLVETGTKGSLLLPHPYIAEGGHTVRAAVKISRRRYDAWLAEISAPGAPLGTHQ